jgi:cellulose synthase/poly-beta-1,6-N-acetylglucosamine synthase-like glycosyltransferase
MSDLKADYLRVTHPCATSTQYCYRASVDLHVLGTPPTFVLSQDQTLRKLEDVLGGLGCDYEVVFIDDGSTDKSFERIKEINREELEVSLHKIQEELWEICCAGKRVSGQQKATS